MTILIYTFNDGEKLELLNTGFTVEEIWKLQELHGKATVSVRTDVIEDIKAEIKKLDKKVCSQFLIEDIDKEIHHTYQEVLQIIDKHSKPKVCDCCTKIICGNCKYKADKEDK